MAKSAGEDPFPLSEMMTQSFEQTRKAMDKYLDLFRKNITATPWLESDLNKKMKSYTEQNIAAASEFAKKLTQAKDFQAFWQIQSEFMQAQLKALGEQTRELGEIVTKTMTGSFKDFSS